MKRTIFIAALLALICAGAYAADISETQLKPIDLKAELTAQRTQYAKYYDRGNGHTTAVISIASRHYLDALGKWQDINTDIETVDGSTGRSHRVIENTIKSFWSGGRFQVAQGDQLIEVRLGDVVIIGDGARRSLKVENGRSLHVSKNTLTYADVTGQLREAFTVLPDQVQYGIELDRSVLHQGVTALELSYKIDLPTGRRMYRGGKSVDANQIVNDAVDIRAGNDVPDLRLCPFQASFKGDDQHVSMGSSRYAVADDGRTVTIIVRVPIDVLLKDNKGGKTISVISAVSIYPSDDSYIDSKNASSSYGSSNGIRVGSYSANPELRGLLKFPLSSIPANVAITSGYMYGTENIRYGSSTNTNRIYAYPVTASWSEGAVTWSSINSYYSTSYYAYVDVDGAAGVSYAWGITSMVSAWYEGTLANHGVMLIGNLSSSDDAFYSKDCGTSSNYPYLYVTYEPRSDLVVSSAPSGWSGSIVVSHNSGSTTSDPYFNPGDVVYISGAVYNNSSYNIVGGFTNTIAVNGSQKASWVQNGLQYLSFTTKNSVSHTVVAGANTIRLTADVNGNILETYEDNNIRDVTIYGNRPPNACGLTAPTNGATGIAIKPTFTWTFSDPDGDPINNSYIQISTNSSFTGTIVYEGWLGAVTSWVYTGNLNRGVTYYWRVKTKDALAEGPYSSVFSFTTTTMVHVSGVLKYTNKNYYTSAIRNLDHVRVELYDYAVPVLLASGYTDANGNFDFGQVNVAAATAGDFRLLIRYMSDAGVGEVKDGHLAGEPVMDLVLPDPDIPNSQLQITSDGTIYYNRPLEYDLVSDDQEATGNEGLAACYLYDAATRSKRFAESNGSHSVNPVSMLFDYENTSGTPGYTIAHLRIDMYATPDAMIDQNGNYHKVFYGSTPYHEYAHHVMGQNYFFYGSGAICLPRSQQSPTGHNAYAFTDPGFALMEGWAEFMPCAVNNDVNYCLSMRNGNITNIEYNDWAQCGLGEANHGRSKGDVCEGVVASILWDIFDAGNADEAGCSMNRSFNDIIGTCRHILSTKTPPNISLWQDWTLQPEGMVEYYDSWCEAHAGSQTTELKQIYYLNGISLDHFSTTYEGGTPSPKIDNVMYRQNVSDAGLQATVIGPDNGVTPHSGDYMYKVTGYDNSASASYVYWKMFDAKIPLMPGLEPFGSNDSRRYLSFWVYVPAGNPGQVGLDFVTKLHNNIRDYQNTANIAYAQGYIADQNGQRLHPAARNVPTDQWVKYTFDLEPLYFMNDTITQILVAYDDGGAVQTGNILAYIDDIEVSDYIFPTLVCPVINGQTSATIGWTDRNFDEDGFGIWLRKGNDDFTAAPTRVVGPLEGVGAVGTSRFDGLEAGATYNIMVRAHRDGQYSAKAPGDLAFNLVPPLVNTVNPSLCVPYGENQARIRFFGITTDVTYVELEKRTDGGAWQLERTIPTPQVYFDIEDTVEVNHVHEYRARGFNGIGASAYFDVPTLGLAFHAPQITGVTISGTTATVNWTDDSDIGNGYRIFMKRASDTEWTMNDYPSGQARSWQYYYLEPMTAYQFKIARYWYAGYNDEWVRIMTPESQVATAQVPTPGLTQGSNARKLYRGTDNALHATFWNAESYQQFPWSPTVSGDVVYEAHTDASDFSWSVNNPGGDLSWPNPHFGIQGQNPTTCAKSGTSYAYLVRALADSVVIDSIGAMPGQSRVIEVGGGGKYNPTSVCDGAGNLHIAWAETTLTREETYAGGHQYRWKVDHKVCYRKRTEGSWGAKNIIQPTEVYYSDWSFTTPIAPAVDVTAPSLVVTTAGGAATPHISWLWNHIWGSWPFGPYHKHEVYYSGYDQGTGSFTPGVRVSPVETECPTLTMAVRENQPYLVWQQEELNSWGTFIDWDVFQSAKTVSSWTTPVNLSDGNAGHSQQPTAAVATDGTIHVLWQDLSTSGYVDLVYPAGATSGNGQETERDGAVAVQNGPSTALWQPSVSADAMVGKDGGAGGAPADDPACQIFYRRYKDGQWGQTYRLTSDAAASQYPALPLSDGADQMGFLFTRDGGVRYQQLPDIDPPTVALTSPNGGELWRFGLTYPISWQGADNRGVAQYKLYVKYIVGGVVHDWAQIATVTGGVASHTWQVPWDIDGQQAWVKVVAIDQFGNTSEDESDAPFVIVPPAIQFLTGFETTDPTPLSDAVYQSSSVDQQLAGPVAAENGVTPHGGTMMYKISGNDNNGENIVNPDRAWSQRQHDRDGGVPPADLPIPDGYCWWQLYDPEVVVGGDMYLSFWLYVKQAPTNPAHIFVDAITRSGKRLSLLNDPMYLCDTTGKRIAASLHTVPTGAWKNYIVNLSKSNYVRMGLDGEVIDRLLLGYDDGANTEGGAFTAYLDDLAIKAGNPAPNKWYAAGFGNDANAAVGKVNQTLGAQLTMNGNGGDGTWCNWPWLLYEFATPQGISPDATVSWTQYDLAHALQFSVKVRGGDGAWRWLCYAANGQNHAGEYLNDGTYGFVTMSDPNETYNIWETFTRNISADYTALYGMPGVAVGASGIGHFADASWTGDHGGSDPCRDKTQIRYTLRAPAEVTVTVYNVAGQKVRTLAPGMRPAGSHAVVWDGRDAHGKAVAGGMYLYRLEAGRFSDLGKVMLIR